MVSKEECIKIMGFYEARKLDVLAILSNPFKNHFDDKEKFVIELAVEQAKIEDQIFLKFGIDLQMFIKAGRHYGLLKGGKYGKRGRKGAGPEDGRMHKDAVVIENNFNIN